MLSVFYMFEAIFYSLVNFLPYLLLALFPFRDSLRFSKKKFGCSYCFIDALPDWYWNMGHSF